MEAVGYDMYCKILEEAVRELKGETVLEEIPVSVDLNVDAYIPEKYISNHDNRIEMYKKIAAINELKDSYEVEEEMEDRYGDIPPAVANLLAIALIKSMAKELNIVSIKQSGNNITIRFMDDKSIDMKTVIELMEEFKSRLMFTASNKPYITVKLNNIENKNVLENIKIILQKLKQLKLKGF